AGATNGSSRFLEFMTSKGDSVLELLSTPTKISGVHYVQGTITFHDVIDKSHDRGAAQIRLEGVYIWPFRQLRMVANRYMFNFIVLFFVITKRLCFSFVRAKTLSLTFVSPTLALLVYATNCICLKHRGQQTLIIKIALQQKDIFILLCPLRTFACFLNVNLGQQSTTTLS
uniref:Uncharacterized protein n=1 Tax=Aegilops tauschii subsp. strangulata TaxID=200361 RepID=A0A453BFL3_AEGTS